MEREGKNTIMPTNTEYAKEDESMRVLRGTTDSDPAWRTVPCPRPLRTSVKTRTRNYVYENVESRNIAGADLSEKGVFPALFRAPIRTMQSQ